MNYAIAVRIWLRTVAILIALAALWDPTVTSQRQSRPTVALMNSTEGQSGAVAQLRRQLARNFVVVAGNFPAADAAVMVGGAAPMMVPASTGPIFVVRDSTPVEIVHVDLPATAPLDGRTIVAATVRVTGPAQPVSVTLSANGTTMDRVEREIAPRVPVTVSLTFVPAAPGPVRLRVTARPASATDTAHDAQVDALLDVEQHPWRVLFYDPRPSWMSTFVRRALLADDRFVVTSRVVTSRNLSSDVGRVPAGLDPALIDDAFDVVVVGAPEALSAADLDGLQGFMRRRGGSVVLLLDQRPSGSWQQLAGATSWAGDSGSGIVAIGRNPLDSAAMRGAQMVWPSTLPPTATVIAGDSAHHHAVVWRVPVGGGSLAVSGALDAWRTRDPAVSGFDEFWREAIATAAVTAPPPVTVTVSRPVARPGDPIVIHAQLRDIAMRQGALGQPVTARVSASVEAASGDSSNAGPLDLWPGAETGSLTAAFAAPARSGMYRIVVHDNDQTGGAALLVDSTALTEVGGVTPGESLRVAASNGRILTGAQRDSLVPLLLRRLGPSLHEEAWHPMHSLLWLFLFALALAAEWWLRRRSGLA